MFQDEAFPWFADISNYLATCIILYDLNFQQKKRFFAKLKHHFWDDCNLLRECTDQIIGRCVPEGEMEEILKHDHYLEYGGHFNGQSMAAKVFQFDFYWLSLFKDADLYVKS